MYLISEKQYCYFCRGEIGYYSFSTKDFQKICRTCFFDMGFTDSTPIGAMAIDDVKKRHVEIQKKKKESEQIYQKDKRYF